MLKKINHWLESVFSNSDINKLLSVFAVMVVFLWFFADEIAPLFGGILCAYLLEDAVQQLQKRKIPRTIAVAILVFLSAAAVILLLSWVPRFFIQLREAADNLPNIKETLISGANTINAYIPENTKLMPSETNISAGLNTMRDAAAKFVLDNSVNIATNVFSLFLYLILMPLLVFFLLRDKDLLLGAIQRYIPTTSIYGELWTNMDEQFGSYVRGKFIEATIIGVLSWCAFSYFDLNYAFSLAALIALSVFVPFVGAILVTLPVLLLAYLQFGATADFFWIVGIYTLIQTFDGQVLVPLLFSEVVKLHPVAIFFAIIFFGNLWGVWGVFFAIPLASIIKSIIIVIDARRTI